MYNLIAQRMGNLCSIDLFLNYLVGSKESPGRKRKVERGKCMEEGKDEIGKSRNSSGNTTEKITMSKSTGTIKTNRN